MNKEITNSINKNINKLKNNKKNMKIKNIVIIILIICAILFIIYYLINHTNIFYKKEMNTKTYNITKGNSASPNLDMCKNGCNRGVCRTKNSNSSNFCKYDFQCNYCRDKITNNFYVDLTNYEEVQPTYDIQKKLNNKQRDSLNIEIEENNDYIDELNDKIRSYNNY